MKKNIAIPLSVFSLIVSVLGIFGTQFFSGGSNPPDPIMFVLLLVMGGSAETIAFSAFRNKILKCLPFVIALAFAAWGIYLYATSESWVNATIVDLICDYCAPAVGAAASLILLKKI